MRRIFLPILVFSVLLGLFSCSRAEPRILYGFIELVYYPGREKPEEQYSFFVLPEDDDGIENLSELYLYHDRDGLRWLLGSADWVQHEEDGKTWIGSRHIAMYADAPLPRGQYRAVLINKGGERTERNFTFDGPEEPPYPFPFLSINDGIYRIDSQYPINYLICYDLQGKALETFMLTQIEGSLQEFPLSGNVRTAALWAEDPELRVSAITDVAVVR